MTYLAHIRIAGVTTQQEPTVGCWYARFFLDPSDPSAEWMRGLARYEGDGCWSWGDDRVVPPSWIAEADYLSPCGDVPLGNR